MKRYPRWHAIKLAPEDLHEALAGLDRLAPDDPWRREVERVDRYFRRRSRVISARLAAHGFA